jgi:hypothetical protein
MKKPGDSVNGRTIGDGKFGTALGKQDKVNSTDSAFGFSCTMMTVLNYGNQLAHAQQLP